MLSAYARICALASPAFLLLYAVLRLIDGLDGHRGRGYLWNLGHTAFLLSFVLLAALLIGVRMLIAELAPRQQAPANAAVIAAVLGVGCFLWVTVRDIFASFPGLPDAVEVVGPLLFQVGVLTLLVQLVVLRRLPVWSPVLVFAGFLAIAAVLDLLPVGAVLIGIGLAPLAGRFLPLIKSVGRGR